MTSDLFWFCEFIKTNVWSKLDPKMPLTFRIRFNEMIGVKSGNVIVRICVNLVAPSILAAS